MTNSVSSLDPEDHRRVSENLEDIRERIEKACDQSGRDPEEVSICAVTKTRPVSAIHSLVDLGIHQIGENRVQEAEKKFRHLPDSTEFHLVGHLQSNKTSLAVQMFDVVQSVDRMKTIRYLQRHCEKRDLRMPVFLQVNVAGEEQKYGFDLKTVPEAVEEIASSSCLQPQGLMTMAPFTDDPEEVRPVFEELRTIRDQTVSASGDPGAWTELSMGMTQDYHVAVEEGATVVRIGTALFEGTSMVS